jgi:[ribosomal protein S5]-alanine N-acetyltransferase
MNPIVRGEKVWLRAFAQSDLPAYHKAVNDSEVAFWAGYTAPLGMDQVNAWYEKRVKGEHGSSAYYFAICPLGSDEFIGTAWLWNLDSRIGGAEFSIFIAEPGRWAAGTGTDALRAVTDFGFGFLELDRIWLLTSAENTRAQRSFEKAGFVREGVLRGHHYRRGRLVEAVIMGMLRGDWQALDRPRSWDYASQGGEA